MKTQFLSAACALALVFNADAQRMGNRGPGNRAQRGNFGNRGGRFDNAQRDMAARVGAAEFDGLMEAEGFGGPLRERLQGRMEAMADQGFPLATDEGVPAAIRRSGRRGRDRRRGKLPMEVLEACSDVIDFDCDLDVTASELAEELAAIKVAREEGMNMEISDEFKLDMEAVRQCLKTVVPELPEDDECRLAMPSRGGRRDHGRGRKVKVNKLERCAADIDQECDLDFEVGSLLDSMATLKAAKEEGLEVDEALVEQVKAQAMEAHSCLREIYLTLPEDGECRTRPNEDEAVEVPSFERL